MSISRQIQDVGEEYARLPYFDGFPYLITRVVGCMFHIIPLPKDLPATRLREVARGQASANRLDTCLLLDAGLSLFIDASGYEHLADGIPKGGIIVVGKLV